MTPTNLRAALRDDRATLVWLARDLRRAFHDMHDADDDVRAAHAGAIAAMDRLVALADAPPTVAELLPLVDATHEVHASRSGIAIRFRLHRSARVPMPPVDTIVVERHHQGLWWPTRILPSDITQPARLVEVTP